MATCVTTLSAGIPKGCKSIGGVSRFLLANKSNVLSYSGATEGYIDSITMSGGTKFYEFVTTKFSSTWSDNNIGNGYGSIAFQPTITMNFSKNEASKRNAVKILAQAEVVALVQNADGNWFYLGETNGLEMNPGGTTYTPGVAISDLNQWVVQLQGGEPEPAKQVDSAIISSLL